MEVFLRRLAIQVMLLGFLCGGGDVRAEIAVTQAVEHAARARQLFAEQKYAEAAEALQRAFAFEAKPLYLFNAGTAYRKADKRQEALGLYQRYLGDKKRQSQIILQPTF